MSSHFLTVYDTGKHRKNMGKHRFMVVELEGGYDMVMTTEDSGMECEDVFPETMHQTIPSEELVSWKQGNDVFLFTTNPFHADDLNHVKQMIVRYHRTFHGDVQTILPRKRWMEKILETHVLASMDMDGSKGVDTYLGTDYPYEMICTYVRRDQIDFEDLHIQRYGRSPFHTPMILLTLLGSCRQSSIKTFFRMTSIFEELNYPHSTREILQQIRFLKDKTFVPKEWTRYVFRRGQMGGCKEDVPDDLYEKWSKQFRETGFFLLEIASRKSYTWRGLELHHMAWENHQLPFREEIVRRELTEEEMEHDLLEIRKELHPRPMLVVSHFTWEKQGKRYDLIRCIEKLCHRLDIPFWDQSEAIVKHGKQIVMDEPTPTHYTRRGGELVSVMLYDRIAETLCSGRGIMHHVYYTDEERVARHTFHGLGDFLRGTIYLFQECRKNDVELKVSYSHHHLEKILVCNNYLSVEECRQARYIFMFNQTETLWDDKMLIFSNQIPQEPIDEECKTFLREKCLQPRLGFSRKLETIMDELDLKKGGYCVLHVRLLDEEVFQASRLSWILKLVSQVYEKEACRIVFMSSHPCYNDHVAFPYVVKTGLDRGHLGLYTTTLKQAEDTMMEFMIMTRCKKIYQGSVYEWGSGFSQIAHLVYNVPLEKIR